LGGRPGDASTLFPGEYISRICDGSGYEPAVGCTECTDACDTDDEYMRVDVVCTGKLLEDTRPARACVACTSRCSEGAYVSDRCLRSNKPTNNTARCVNCAPCENGQFVSKPCSGATYMDARECSRCMYGKNRTGYPPSLARKQCPLTTQFVLNECVDGVSTVDESTCSQCNENCASANYTAGSDGQYIYELCSSLVDRDNVCAKCSGRCLSYEANPPGQYIIGFCTGTTLFDRTCAACRLSCTPGTYIAGERCNGETNQDTTTC